MTDGWTDEVRTAFGSASVSVDGPLTVDVAAADWLASCLVARDGLGCSFFDWLSAVDELSDGFRVVCHVARLGPPLQHVALRTRITRDDARLATVSGVWVGAAWHERETHEMFGIAFHDDGREVSCEPLLLPSGFVGHPLRKDFVLASRVVQPWPGVKEPGESGAPPVASGRRRTAPAGVPAAEAWGPREPGSPTPDPLEAASVPGRRRRARRVSGPDDDR